MLNEQEMQVLRALENTIDPLTTLMLETEVISKCQPPEVVRLRKLIVEVEEAISIINGW